MVANAAPLVAQASANMVTRCNSCSGSERVPLFTKQGYHLVTSLTR